MTGLDWRRSPSFGILCDVVASDKLVCVTGAGISSGLPQKLDPSKKLPQWPELLELLFLRFELRLSTQDRDDCRRLLRLDADKSTAKEWPTGPELILCASILRKVDPAAFDLAFREAVTNQDGSFSPTHKLLLDLKPAGILTFNYDSGHENAAALAGIALKPMLPSTEAELVEALKTGTRPFYLKAHGSLDSALELVLTQESYREVLVKAPTYRAFVQNVLTNFSLLFVGFRISDPDFDAFIDAVAYQFGSPLRSHVALFHNRERSVDDIALRRRYGIHVLYFSDFGDVPHILSEALSTPGPVLQRHLERSLSTRHQDRDAAHAHFVTLGLAGRVCASNALRSRIDALVKASDHFALSEVAYSLGIIDAKSNKALLMDFVENAQHADPAGRALTVLRPALLESDLPPLQSWIEKFRRDPLPGTHADRIEKYIDYLLTYIPAKFRS